VNGRARSTRLVRTLHAARGIGGNGHSMQPSESAVMNNR
jgi:hypothetical protein